MDNESGKKVKFQIDCVRDTILIKKSKGKDTSFEEGLLESWRKYPGYGYAKEVLVGIQGQDSLSGVLSPYNQNLRTVQQILHGSTVLTP